MLKQIKLKKENGELTIPLKPLTIVTGESQDTQFHTIQLLRMYYESSSSLDQGLHSPLDPYLPSRLIEVTDSGDQVMQHRIDNRTMPNGYVYTKGSYETGLQTIYQFVGNFHRSYSGWEYEYYADQEDFFNKEKEQSYYENLVMWAEKILPSLAVDIKEKNCISDKVKISVCQTISSLLMAKEESLVVLDYPCAFLSDSQKVELANLIAETVQRGVQVVFSTHSDVMIVSISVLVYQGLIDPSDIHVLFHEENQCTPLPLPLAKSGRLLYNPIGFMDTMDKLYEILLTPKKNHDTKTNN